MQRLKEGHAYQFRLNVILGTLVLGLLLSLGLVIASLRPFLRPAQFYRTPPRPVDTAEVCPGDTIKFTGQVGIERRGLLMRVRVWYPQGEPWEAAQADREPEYFIHNPMAEREVTIEAEVPESLPPGAYDLRVGLYDFEAARLLTYDIPVNVGECEIP